MGSDISMLFVDPATLPNNVGGFIQVLFLMAAYAFVLFNASNLISVGFFLFYSIVGSGWIGA